MTTATAGSIVDDVADAVVDITGDVVTLTAAGDIGETAGFGFSLDTTAVSLDVSSTVAGVIHLNETDAVTLTDIDTANGSITISTSMRIGRRPTRSTRKAAVS